MNTDFTQEELCNFDDELCEATVELEAAQDILAMFIARHFSEYENDAAAGSLDLSMNWQRAYRILLHVSGLIAEQVNKIEAAQNAFFDRQTAE